MRTIAQRWEEFSKGASKVAESEDQLRLVEHAFYAGAYCAAYEIVSCAGMPEGQAADHINALMDECEAFGDAAAAQAREARGES